MKKLVLILSGLFFTYSTVSSQVVNLTNGLVGHFPLTTDGYDKVNNLTYTSTDVTQVSNGVTGSTALSFNDVSSVITADNSSRNITSEISVSVWVKTTSTDASECIAAKYDYTEDRGFALFISGGKAKIDGRNGNNIYISSGVSTTSVNDGLWHHITAIANQKSFQIWVDGNKESEYTFCYPTQNYNATIPDLLIGRSNVHPGNGDFYFYEGALNELLIYNRTLTECEIKALASSGSAVQSLVGSFPLNSNSNDVSNVSVNGIAANITYETGRTSGTQAASFNNSTSVIDCGSSSRNITSEVTVSAWVKTTSADVSNCVLSKYNHTEDKGFNLFISGGKAKMDGRNNTNTYISSGASLTSVNDGQWHHLLGIANKTGFQIWVDGVKESEYTFTVTNVDYNATTKNLLIGRNSVHPGNGDYYFFGGLIADVQIYNRTLQLCEIQELSETAVAVSTVNTPVAYFDLDANVVDQGSLQIDGTPYNLTLTPFAFTFNNTDSYIDAGSSSRNISTKVTASAWVKTTSTDAANCILSKYDPYQDKGYALFISGGKAKIDGRNGNNIYFSSGPSTTSVNDGQWHFITGVATATSFQIFVDGEKESEYVFSGTTPDYNTTTQNLLIGRNCVHPGNGDFYYYGGQMKDVKLFNTALSECDILQLYQNNIVTDPVIDGVVTSINKIATVSPNPFDQQFVLTFNNTNDAAFEITLSDSNGKIVSQHTGTGNSFVHTGEQLATGLYIGKVVLNENVYVFKVVKK
jgi:hypothetical protein